MTAEPENTGAIQGGRFKPGESGNPAGKPKGARHKTTVAVMALLEGEAEAITRKTIEKAKKGDITAIRLCLERIAPARKDCPVAFILPEIGDAMDAAKAMGAVLVAVASGDITPSEGSEVAKLVEIYIKVLETSEIETRLRTLEERHGR